MNKSYKWLNGQMYNFIVYKIIKYYKMYHKLKSKRFIVVLQFRINIILGILSTISVLYLQVTTFGIQH